MKGKLKPRKMDNMVMAVIPRDEAEQVIGALIESGFPSTVLYTKGGALRRSQSTLFIVVDDHDLERVFQVIENNYKAAMRVNSYSSNLDNNEQLPTTNKLGGAVVFVWKTSGVKSF